MKKARVPGEAVDVPELPQANVAPDHPKLAEVPAPKSVDANARPKVPTSVLTPDGWLVQE